MGDANTPRPPSNGAVAAASTSRLRQFINSPAGPKTIFFWAPAMKWALVIAGLRDINRPVERVSTAQNVALAATGAIWARWSFQIVPKNYSLATVNVFVCATGLYHLARKAKAYMATRSA
ncbi:hypothetical protein CCYA_CCYA19G4669 [Cyanidiococcus yangmingshanensis]|uniref:Mitochondrial pyruvate carrier n=1 Tax=Cyanidiococcus yangmingshanensis TaxID=2690220 RepID=A0A7J7ID02_9RHOD|nr:Mitochondrial pyruvate carrier 2 [Cyanidiococcus yangmingshanensis]KAK4533787.1 hypothetical protein CCYA_CCYA19G4669 [Cyanidiococcus yangmingshanensis]